ncbi:MAG: phosphatase PAP2 family protein [Actinomycetota bacterium]
MHAHEKVIHRTVALGATLLMLGASFIAPPAQRSARAAAANAPTDSRTFLMTSPDQFRLGAPPAPGSAKTRRELRTIRRLQDDLTRRQRRRVEFWNDVPATQRWTETAIAMVKKYKDRPPFAARALVLLHTGLYDAMVAAFDSQNTYFRRAPYKVDDRIDPLFKERGTSYAPEEAAIAGAAGELLPYLFPLEPPATFEALVDEAIKTRKLAGVNYPSDVKRARRLGREAAALFIARGNSDGSTNTGFAYPRPEGEQYWEPTPPPYESPIGGPIGTWLPWALESPSEARVASGIPPPPAYGSEEFMTDLFEVMDVHANLTDEQKAIATFWDDGPGTGTPPGHWNEIALDLLDTFDITGTKKTAEIFALLNVVNQDSAIAFFEAKYFWWSIRPITAVLRLCDDGTVLCTEAELEQDPSRRVYACPAEEGKELWCSYITTPPFPSYPAGHSTFSGGAGRLLTHYFPEAGDLLNELAEQAAYSRLLGGIHFRSDNEAGLTLGRTVAELALARWATGEL